VTRNGKKIIVIGGGIGGLCAAVYAQKCGYRAEVLEMHDMAGGLATSWRRGHYTFETCLHWFYGSSPNSQMNRQWREVFDIDRLTFVRLDELVRIETERGDSLGISTDIDRLEAALLNRAPRDAKAIGGFISSVRSLRKFKMPDLTDSWAARMLTLAGDAPYLPLLAKLSKISGVEYGRRFTDPLLRSFFGDGETGQMSAIALCFSIAWMGAGNADYAVGGSQAIIRLIEEKLAALGGRVRFGARVARILVENDAAVGVQLEGGEAIAADWVISAADGHATIFDLLGGKYAGKFQKELYEKRETFPSYLQVSLGVAMDLSKQPSAVSRLLDSPLQVDPCTQLACLPIRIFHFDPTFAPAGKTAVTCFLPTRNHDYWVKLEQSDGAAYRAEKHRVAEAVIAVLERMVPGIRQAIEVVDVSTPATVIRYTGNWKGSMEGWFLTPGTGFSPFPNTLPGLRRFMMVGQWISPGGGLPSGPITAKPAIRDICKQDHVPFTPR
jgi:phytoene dehydrogenase-like protein